MCIIGIKEYNAPDFTESVLKRCWDRNSDGAGYATWKSDLGLWEIKKGFMKWGEFISSYKKENFSKDNLVFVHFRIGTSGLKDAGNTHPFEISDDVSKMRVIYTLTDKIAIHNGVVGQGEGDASDTIIYIRDYLSPLMAIWDDKRVSEKIADSILSKGASRWIVAVGDKWWKYGTWHKHNEWEFSNTSYEESRVVYSTYSRSTPNIYTPAAPSIWPTDKDEWYEKLEKENLLPWGYYSGGVQNGEKGFWQGGKFCTWKKWYEDKNNRGSLSQPKQGDKPKSLAEKMLSFTKGEFTQHYFQPYYLKSENGNNTSKVYSVMNWSVFSVGLSVITRHFQDRDTSNSIEVISDGNEIAVIGTDDDAELKRNLEELKICPVCFDDKNLGESDFNVGDTKCLTCGCVFDLRTGVALTYDLDIYRVYSKTHTPALV